MNKLSLYVKYFFVFSAILGVISLALSSSQAELLGDYVGWKSCKDCHEEIADGWQKTKHAQAFDHLKKDGKDNTPGCVKCHVVNFEGDGGFIAEDLTPELAGVQCESCHGPGKAHVGQPDKEGSIILDPGEKNCRQCHTKSQDANFDYKAKSKLVHGK